MRVLLILFVFFNYGCSKKAVVEKVGKNYRVRINTLRINNLSVLPWYVGIGRIKTEISKGFFVNFQLPNLSQKSLELLYQEFKIDSYVIKVSRDRNERQGEHLGYFKVPFSLATGRGAQLVKPGEARFRIHFAAASISERYSYALCPAFNHSLKITRIEDIQLDDTEQLILLGRGRLLQAKIPEATFVPVDFNGGMSLRGEYRIEIAFFNSEYKTTMSDFFPLQSYVKVTREEPKVVRNCEGAEEPPHPMHKGRRFQDIKFFDRD